MQEGTVNDVDQKQTVVNFLASVVYDAELLGISYEKIFYPNNSLVQEKSKTAAQAVSASIMPAPLSFPAEQLPYELPQEEQRNPENLLEISLLRHGELVLRKWE